MTPDLRRPEGLSEDKSMSLQAWRMDALRSADADGKVSFLESTDWFKAQSAIMGMWLDGLIERRCKPTEAGPWFITPAGRLALTNTPDLAGGDRGQ